MKKIILAFVVLTASAFAQISGAGQLGCSPTPTTGTAWNSVTSGNTTQTLLSGVSATAALVQLDQTTTITGGAVTFQLSYDGTNWITVPLPQVLNPSTGLQLTNPYTLVASTNKPFLIPLAGATNLRLNLSTVITGTGAITPFTTAICNQSQPVLSTDASGNVLMDLATSLPGGSNVLGGVTANVTQQNGVALGSPSAYGTAPTGNVPGTNAFITNGTSLAAVPPVTLAQAVNTQKTSSTAVTSITNAFVGNTTAANSIVCVGFSSSATTVPAFTDGQGNTYIVAAASAASGTAPGYTVAVAENIVGGTTDTITLTFTSGAGSFACYEFKNGVTVGVGWDFITSLQATSAALTFQQQSATLPLELVIAAVGMGGGTVNATPGLAINPSGLTTVDAANTNPNSGAAGAALSDFYAAHTLVSGIPTGFIQSLSLSASETYSAILISVKPIAQTVQTNVSLGTIGGQPVSLYGTLFPSGTSATATSTGFATRVPGLSGYGSLQITGTGITGSPSGCTIALAYQPNTGTPATGAQTTIAFTPATSTQLIRVAMANPSGDQIVPTYTCGTYPTGGTIAVTFAPQNSDWAEFHGATWPASYSASKSFAGSSTTDNAVLPGNATNTVYVTRVIVTCTETTAGIVTLSVVKRSAADTSGTSAAFTVVPDDANYIAGVTAPLSYTGTGPTVGTPVGNVDTAQFGCNAAATAGPNDVYVLDLRTKPITLRGTAQQLALNFGGAITGGTLTVTYAWEERP